MDGLLLTTGHIFGTAFPATLFLAILICIAVGQSNALTTGEVAELNELARLFPKFARYDVANLRFYDSANTNPWPSVFNVSSCAGGSGWLYTGLRCSATGNIDGIRMYDTFSGIYKPLSPL